MSNLLNFFRIGEHRTEMLAPWLDNLVALSLDGLSSDRFHRAQSLLSAILDVVFTYHNMETEPVGAVRPARREALHVSGLLASDLSRRWLASELAEAVYLSESQLRRVFFRSLWETTACILDDTPNAQNGATAERHGYADRKDFFHGGVE